MKAILLGILAGFATAKEIINHEDPTINILVPTQPLEWGDGAYFPWSLACMSKYRHTVNVLHTTDLHGE
jgi:hypothetical protein